MHCPRCGADALVGQQFCRSCGFNLEKVAELLGEQLPDLSSAEMVRARQHQRRLEHWASIAGLTMMLCVLIMLTYLIVSQMIIKNGQVVGGLLLLTVIVGGAVMACLQAYSKQLKQRLSTTVAPPVADLLPLGATKQLDPHREPAQSVTEHTTELLTAHPVQRRVDTKEV